MLGRHTDATKDTSAIYSRDLSVKSVTALQKVIDAIHEGSFKPDETRKGYFQNDVIEIPPEVSVGHTSAKVENIEIKDDDSECVNLVSGDSEGQDANEDLISSEDSGITFKHCTSKTVHYVAGLPHQVREPSLVFSCGRKVSAKYAEVNVFDPFNMCSMCKKHARRDGASRE